MFNDDRPLIAVVGALSKQGRSVVHSLLASGRYRVRALTRRIDAPEALAMAEMGAELQALTLALGQGDSLLKGFQGAYGAFLMTPPIAPPDTSEAQLGKLQADAAVDAGVQHVVFSTLANVDQLSNGSKWAPYFTDKALVEEYIRSLDIASSFIQLAFFYTNLIEYYTPRMEGHTLVFPIYLPEDFQAPFVDPLTATGPAVLEIFDSPAQYVGRTLPVLDDMISPRQMVDTFQHVTGIKSRYGSAYGREQLLRYFPDLASNEGLVREIVGMAEFAVEYGYYRDNQHLSWSRKIHHGSVNWEQFLRATDWQGQSHSYGARR